MKEEDRIKSDLDWLMKRNRKNENHLLFIDKRLARIEERLSEK